MPGTTAPTPNAVMRTLGATYVQGEDADRTKHVGNVGGYGFAPPATFTGNVTIDATANAIVINARAYEQLDNRQRSILATAANQTRAWAIASMRSDARNARDYCGADPEGNRVVLASGADIAALQAATASVYGELERDPLTRRVIARIRDLKRRLG